MMSTKSLKKSGTFISERSPTMQNQTFPPPSIKTQGDQGISHFGHPQHPLLKVNFPHIFTCMGCKEYGAGKRYRCNNNNNCDFELHEFCALAPPSIQNHSLHNQHQHQLVFYTKPAMIGGFLRSKCDICGKATRGYVFRCGTCNFEMHPCCAEFTQEKDFSVHPHTLKLLPVTTLSSDFVCRECKRKRSGRVYTCSTCDYHLHAVCAKEMVNGLHDNGIKPPGNPSMLGAAARIASHVILGFIGGLIEGIGEGVGEVMAENIGKGKPTIIRTNYL